MFIPKLTRDITQLWQKGINRANQLDEKTNGWSGIVIRSATHAWAPDSVIKAAAIAYFANFPFDGNYQCQFINFPG